MSRKFIIVVVTLIYFFSLSIGLISSRVTESSTVQKAPITIASSGSTDPAPPTPVKPFPGGSKGGGATTNGGSWGG